MAIPASGGAGGSSKTCMRPPLSTATESRPPSSASAVVQGGAVAAQDSSVALKAESTLEPSVTATATSRNVQPSSAPYDAPPKRNRRFAVMLVGVGLLGVGGGVAATFYALKPSLKAAATQRSASTPIAVAAVTAIASVPRQPQQQDVAAASASAAPAQGQVPSSAEPTKSDTAGHEKMAAVRNLHSPAAAAPAAAAPVAAVDARNTAKASGPSESNVPALLDSKNGAKPATTKTAAGPAASPTPAKAGGSGPFPKEVAMAMLGVAASQAPSCKKPGGPAGTGKAIVTFDPDGSAVITNIVGEGFPGTPTGQCLASLFRRVRVPPFGGERAVATKIFTIPQ